jgi:hypothetical protein
MEWDKEVSSHQSCLMPWRMKLLKHENTNICRWCVLNVSSQLYTTLPQRTASIDITCNILYPSSSPTLSDFKKGPPGINLHNRKLHTKECNNIYKRNGNCIQNDLIRSVNKNDTSCLWWPFFDHAFHQCIQCITLVTYAWESRFSFLLLILQWLCALVFSEWFYKFL